MWLPLWWSYLHLDQYCGYMWPWRRLQVHVLQCSFGDSAQEFKKVPHPGFENNTIQDLKKPSIYHMKYWKYWKPQKITHWNQCPCQLTQSKRTVHTQSYYWITRNLQGSINTLHQSTFKPPKILKKKGNNNKQVIKWKS